MSGFGNKNPPWGRGGHGMGGGMPPHLGMVEQNFGGGGMLQQGLPLQQQGMGLAGMAPQGMAPVAQAGISYPAPRGVAPGGFLGNIGGNILQQQQAAMSVMGNVNTSQAGPGPGQPSQRVFTGTVTKLHDNFGFVDDDVFFQTSVCKGQVPRVNDRVLVEAAFNPNMPFKWNATRVQVLPNQAGGGQGMGGGQGQGMQGGGGPGGPGGRQGGGMGEGMRGGGGFQPTNQLGSAFGGGEGGPGGPHGGPREGRERNSRFDGGNGGMRNMRGGGHGGDMRGEERGGGPDMRGGPMMRGGDHMDRGRGPHGGEMRGGDMRGNDMRGPGNDMGGPGMRGGGGGGGGNDRRNNDRPQRSPPRRPRPERQERQDQETAGREEKRGGRWDAGEPREKESQARSSRKRSRSPSRRSRSPARRSRSRSRSPPRRRARTTPRYNVSVPKISLNFPSSNVMELKKRYTNLYVPSDFFHAKHLWNEAFPIQEPFRVQHASSFHTFKKDDVEPPSPDMGPQKWQFDPPDADYSWVAKVMLLASPGLEDLYEKTCNFVETGSREREELVHPTRALKFLVGLKEKREMMALGGPWSPSLDGAGPGTDPSTLIRTETVVIFFPDVWSVMPNKLEYDGLAEQYLAACKAKQEGKNSKEQKGEEEVQEVVQVEEDGVVEEEEVAEVTETGEEEGSEAKVVGSKEAAHWATLDPKTMKVGELRDQLEVRGQLNKGLKSQLLARLQKCLKTEQEAEETKSGDAPGGSEDMVTEDSEKVKEKEAEAEVMVVLDDRQKEKIASAYKTPSNPCIFVHPNTKVKGGKFDCKTESLSVLLDYRSEDNKEGTFEVSLFAELFNEMFIRDSAFKLFTAVQTAAEKPKEEKKEKKEEVVIPPEAAKEAAVAGGEAAGESKEVEEKEKVEEKREASVEMVGEEKEKVMVTKNKDLLLGASYFDLSHCGYLETKDLEEILLPLELDLSRAEIKKLSSKLATKDQFHYRQLTDGEAGQEEEQTTQDQELAELAKGFRRFLPSAGEEESAPTEEGVVRYKGSVVDVAKLQQKLEKSEKVRSATDSKLIELQRKYTSLKEKEEKGERTREKMSSDLRESRKKSRGLEEEVASSAREAARYLSTLGEVYHKVMPIVRPPKATEVKGTETMPQVNGIAKEGEAVETPKAAVAAAVTAAAPAPAVAVVDPAPAAVEQEAK